MRFLPTLTFLLLSATFGGPEPKQDFTLSKHKAGFIDIGISVDSVYTLYGRENTCIKDLYTEGDFSPVVEIYLVENPDTLPSMECAITCMGIYEWQVTQVRIFDRRFKTVEGIGVGSSLKDLRQAYKVSSIDFGEGPLSASVEEIDMGFGLDIDTEDIPEEWFQTRDSSLIPDSVKITSIGI